MKCVFAITYIPGYFQTCLDYDETSVNDVLQVVALQCV